MRATSQPQVIKMALEFDWIQARGVEQAVNMEGNSLRDLLFMRGSELWSDFWRSASRSRKRDWRTDRPRGHASSTSGAVGSVTV